MGDPKRKKKKRKVTANYMRGKPCRSVPLNLALIKPPCPLKEGGGVLVVIIKSGI